MASRDKELFHNLETTRQFLFSKTDTERLRDIEDRDIVGGNKVLISVFPDVLVDSCFIEQAMKRLNSSVQFGVMAIRLDHSSLEDEQHTNPQIIDAQVEVAKTLDALCQQENGLWGAIESGLFGSFFPEKNGSQSLKLARGLQTHLAEHTKETVTVGVAAYPTITYKKSEIIEAACKALDHATFFGPNSAVIFDGVSLNISGDKLYEKGDIQGAIEEFKKALLLDPSNVNVHNSLGVCYGLQGNYDQAIEKFKTALSHEPEEYMALYNLGLVNVLTGHRNRALDFFLKADEINGQVFEVALQTGKLYFELGDAEKGKVFLERAAEMEPESGTVYRYLGDCYAVSGMPEEAVSAYKKAIKQNPNDAASMSALGCLFDETGENPEIAVMFCRESVALSPENGLFHYRLGRLYYNQKRFEEALKEFNLANRLGYDSADDIHQTKNLMQEKN